MFFCLINLLFNFSTVNATPAEQAMEPSQTCKILQKQGLRCAAGVTRLEMQEGHNDELQQQEKTKIG